MRSLMAAAAAAGMLAATEAAAENWQPAAANDEMIIGVDVTSIQGDPRLRIATVMLVFARADPGGGDFALSAVGFDCVDHTVALISMDFYAIDGTALSTSEPDANAPGEPIEPGALFETVEGVVCEGQRYPPGSPDGLAFAAAARELLLRGLRR